MRLEDKGMPSSDCKILHICGRKRERIGCDKMKQCIRALGYITSRIILSLHG